MSGQSELNNGGSSARRVIPIVVLERIEGHLEFFQDGLGLGGVGAFGGVVQTANEHPRQNGNDGDGHENLNQGEGLFAHFLFQ